jgi:ATP-dependent exoDNAse (exonuclease V) alpha subunit
MRDAGRLGADHHLGGTLLAVGDHVVLRRNDPGLGVRNGTRGVVTDITPACEVTVQGHDGPEHHLPADYAERHMQHAYALTIHAAQGATVERAHILAPDTGSAAELGYVALSRARVGTDVYVNQQSEREGPPMPLERLRASLAKPPRHTTAVALTRTYQPERSPADIDF